MSLRDNCRICGKKDTYLIFDLCKSCQLNEFKKKFSKYTSGNEKIDGLIQEM